MVFPVQIFENLKIVSLRNTLKSLILSVKLIRFKILYEFNSRDANINIFQCLALAKKQMQSIGYIFIGKYVQKKETCFRKIQSNETLFKLYLLRILLLHADRQLLTFHLNVFPFCRCLRALYSEQCYLLFCNINYSSSHLEEPMFLRKRQTKYI